MKLDNCESMRWNILSVMNEYCGNYHCTSLKLVIFSIDCWAVKSQLERMTSTAKMRMLRSHRTK